MIVTDEPNKLAILDATGRHAVSFNLQSDNQIKVLASGSPVITASEADKLLHWLSDSLSCR